MSTIIFNNKSFPVTSYNRNTSFYNNTMQSEGSASLYISGELINDLYSLSEDNITSIQIANDEEVIYSLSNVNAKLTRIDENYNEYGDNVVTNINLQFNLP